MAVIHRIMPAGPLVKPSGEPTVVGKGYLAGIEEMSKALSEAGGVENLDDETTYSADDLRDKLIELIAALQG